MKKFLYLLMVAMFAIMLPSCGGDDDEPEAKIEVTQSEIQGSWHNSVYGTYHRITFDGSKYSYSQMNVKTSRIEYRENGTYSINGLNIVFMATTNESKLGECEIYWESTYKNQLHIWPIGSYVRAD